MLEFDDPAIKSLLVELDDRTAKGTAWATPGLVGGTDRNTLSKGG